MKHLVILAHPNIEASNVNKTWVNELAAHNDKLTIHNIYKAYPEGQIDIQKEQELLLNHDEIILQFPIFWFSTPAFLKKWLDDVLSYGWAFGPGGDKLKGKKFRLAVSTGGPKASYDDGIPLSTLLKPLEATFAYCGAEVISSHTFYGANYGATPEGIAESGKKYAGTVLNETAVEAY